MLKLYLMIQVRNGECQNKISTLVCKEICNTTDQKRIGLDITNPQEKSFGIGRNNITKPIYSEERRVE